MLEKISNKIVLVVLVALLVVSAAGNYFFMAKSKTLQDEVDREAGQITASNNKLSVEKTETDSWKKKYETANVQCKIETDDLKAKMAAFAKQAAACEQIKQKLHIQ
jgi:Tfp pilus assembly protein PilO